MLRIKREKGFGDHALTSDMETNILLDLSSKDLFQKVPENSVGPVYLTFKDGVKGSVSQNLHFRIGIHTRCSRVHYRDEKNTLVVL